MIKLASIINIPGEVTAQSKPVCFNCGSKIYPGDTIYIIDSERYCEECVEVVEFEDFAV
ncbi:MAG: hypothetical protein LBM59_06455 [Ruminococcus sp.]|nr:hypothetical protein [Ruminococcus sp.]